MRIQKPRKKLYYSIRQVCDMVGISDHILKNWEKKFPQIQPIRNRGGNRYYVEKDLEMLFYIKKLFVEEKLNEEQIRERLQQFRQQKDGKEDVRLKTLLAEIRLEIQEILDLLQKDVSPKD
ncbi:MAG: MerR family transcriptional regulator [Calditrichaeota bacterium]|nr:MerR family transcriptional regulator [Calditrichota bacterium]